MNSSIFSYNGSNITMKMVNGIIYVNATEMAKPFNTRPISWTRTEQAKRLIDAISEVQKCTSVDLVQVSKGNFSESEEQGTWMHEDVALPFAQWLSPEFYILCNSKIKELLKNGYTKLDSISRKDLALLLLEAEEEKERSQQELQAQKAQLQLAETTILEQAPKVEYYNKVLESKGYLTANMVAAELGISVIKLNKLLCTWGVQYSQSGCYFLFSEYRDRGYTVHRPHPYINSMGVTVTAQHMYWTEAGKKFIVELYRKRNA